MTQPVLTQNVLAPPAQAAIFLVARVHAGGEETVRDLLADVSGLTKSAGFGSPEAYLSSVVGIGADFWDRLYDAPRPAGLHTLEPIEGPVHTAVSTPGDILFHLRARRMDLCFALAQRLMARLVDVAEVVDEVHGFRYYDVRDLLGFVDGTENPEGDEADAAVFVGDEDPSYAGGSYVLVQKYLHDLDAWEALSVEEQERVIGRAKLTDIEMSDEEKPTNSHVALNTIEDENGEEKDIVRDNMPFGTLGTREFGTYFIGYTAEPDVIEQMLDNMFLGDPPGNHDRILDFSTAETGTWFFVPPADMLEDGPPAPQGLETQGLETQQPPQPTESDDSLGIGSLKGT